MVKKGKKLLRSPTPEPEAVDLDSDSRPEHSPYASDTCALYFQNEGPLHLHHEILRKSAKLSSRMGWSFSRLHDLRLDDVSLDAGHVLVNFLVTGNYECLKPQGKSLAEKNASEFATALRVYTAAESFELSSLCDLAEKEMQRLGDELSLPSIIDIMEEAGPTSLHTIRAATESRVQSFLRGLTRAAADTVLSELGTPNTISKIILKSVVELQLNSIELPCEKELSEEDTLKEPAPVEEVLPEQYPEEPIPPAEVYEEVAPQEYPEEPTLAEAYEEVAPEQYPEAAPAEDYEVEPQAEPQTAGDAVRVTGLDQFAEGQSFVIPRLDADGAGDWCSAPGKLKKDKKKGKKGRKVAAATEPSGFSSIRATMAMILSYIVNIG
ncbi:uncharacterized protein DNG_06848 [Cephalotrichum gorgonifer]|uniref:BTB domain-containing protein n=1 Tax=Cephalotrichum gorgonifer TaxID=2041049 RepID=A0AAE8N3I1_9PEZI|nr:uncharacterized protein DNG_06848 [Cephalotrichum gorgonifer]